MKENEKIIPFSALAKSAINAIIIDSAEKFKDGICKHLKSYLKRNFPAAVVVKNNNLYVRVDEIGDIATFCEQYLKKTSKDYSAKDIAELALRHIGLPPVETMSLSSLEKTVRSLFDSDKYKDHVYIKRIQGGRETLCVTAKTAARIECDEAVCNLIVKQVKKAEKRNQDPDSIDWKKYEYEKSFIESREKLESEQRAQQNNMDSTQSVNSQLNDKDNISHLSQDEEAYCMIQALFSLFFTEFDFEALDRDIIDYNTLESVQDFGKLYQEYARVFETPNFDWKYYRVKKDNPLLNILAEKVAGIILKKMQEGGNL